jgi:hypothetical protein
MAALFSILWNVLGVIENIFFFVSLRGLRSFILGLMVSSLADFLIFGWMVPSLIQFRWRHSKLDVRQNINREELRITHFPTSGTRIFSH